MRPDFRNAEQRRSAHTAYQASNARLRRFRRGEDAVKAINAGDVVWARQEFHDCDDSKIRPWLVLDTTERHLVVRRMTTRRGKPSAEVTQPPGGRRTWLSDRVEAIDRQRVIDVSR